MAEENAKAAREEQLRVKNANASWQKKVSVSLTRLLTSRGVPGLTARLLPMQCDKLKQKVLKLEHRRGKVASDDEDGIDNEPLAPAPSRSPVKALRRHPTIDSSPEAPLPFKMNVNHVNVPPSHPTTGSGQSRSQSTASAVFSPGSVSSVAAGKRKRFDSQIIDLCSDDDEDQVEVEDDLFAAVNDPALASGSGNWSGFGSKGRLPSQSPSSSSKRQRGMPSVPMPTLSGAAMGREGSVGLWGPKKVELSKQRSDKHLPDFVGGGRGGVKELGPKSRVKMGAKR